MHRSAFFRKRMSRASYIPTKSKTLSSLPAFDHELTRLQGMASHAQRAGFLALAAALIIIPALFLPDANFIDPRSNLSVPILGIGELSLWTGMMVVTIIYCASVFYEQLFWLQLFKEKKHPAFGSVVSFHLLKGIGFRVFQSVLLTLPLLIALLLIYKALPFPQVETKILIILCMGIIFIRFAVIVAMAPFLKAKLFIQVLIFFSIVLLGFFLLLLHTVFTVRTNVEPEWYQRNIWLSKANFSTLDNTRVDLRNKVFNGAIILDSDFGKADLRGASFVRSEITNSLFDHTQLGSTNNFRNLFDPFLFRPHLPQDSSFHLATIKDSAFNDTGGWRVQFGGAKIYRTQFSNAKLPLASFVVSTLKGVSFYGTNTDLRGADFSGANIRSSIFSGANMTGVSFANYGPATIIGNNFEGVKGLDCEMLKRALGWQLNYAPQLASCMVPNVFVVGKDIAIDTATRKLLKLEDVELSSSIIVIKNVQGKKIASSILFSNCDELREIPEWQAIVRTRWLDKDKWNKCLTSEY